MAGVAFAVDGDGVGFATESYAASALYTTLASLSGALWRIRRARHVVSPGGSCNRGVERDMDLGEWLRSLSLEQYEPAFRENGVDLSVLPDLTDQDLEKLGVLLGHRRKLLRAIANSEGLEKTVPAIAAWAAGWAPVAVQPRDAAERRQVTVMFSDLVGSTALSARMDPEDLREVISAYQMCVAGTVRHFGGFVARYMGDGVLIFFGYPAAHEDDAERAVRSGLALID